MKKMNVLDKKFYIVIPFSPLELGTKSLPNVMTKKGLPFPKDQILQHAETVLTPKRDHLLSQLGRLGLKGYQLSTQKLIDLFYDIFNQGAVAKPKDMEGNTTPLVNKQPW